MNNNDIYTDLMNVARKTVGDIVALRVEPFPNGNGLALVAGRPGLEHAFDYVAPDQIRPFLILARGASPDSVLAQLEACLPVVRAKALVVRELERSGRGGNP